MNENTEPRKLFSLLFFTFFFCEYACQHGGDLVIAHDATFVHLQVSCIKG